MTDSALHENESPSVGQILKAARLDQALTLEEVSKNLFITKRQLAVLEEDAEHISCDVYTLGFVKIYAQYLSLNVEEIVEKFKAQKVDHSKILPVAFPAPLPGRGMPSLRILGLSLLILIAIIIAWQWLGRDRMAPALPEIILETPSTLLDSPVEEEPAPLPEDQSALEHPTFTTSPIHLGGDTSKFEDRAFPAAENSEQAESDIGHDPEKHLE